MLTSFQTSPVRGLLRRVRGEQEGLDAVGLQRRLDEPEVGLVPGLVIIPESSVLVLNLESGKGLGFSLNTEA